MKICSQSGNAAASSTGSLSQTRYYLSDFPPHTRFTVVVRLPDGSSMKMSRRWTDVDGVACVELAGDSEPSLRGLHELLGLFLELRERVRSTTGERAARRVVIHDHHDAYIAYDYYLRNQERLEGNATMRRTSAERGAARAGEALLQELVLCGHCGRRMD